MWKMSANMWSSGVASEQEDTYEHTLLKIFNKLVVFTESLVVGKGSCWPWPLICLCVPSQLYVPTVCISICHHGSVTQLLKRPSHDWGSLWLWGNRHCFYNTQFLFLPLGFQSCSKSHTSNWQESRQHYCYCKGFPATFHRLKVCISTSIRSSFHPLGL